MYRRLTPVSAPIDFTFEGEIVQAQQGESLAAALMAQNLTPFRTTPVSDSPRAAYCMMGICFECLVTIDGQPNRQACMTEVRQGMKVTRQRGAA